MKGRILGIAPLLVLCLVFSNALARVTRIEILSREDVLNAAPFGRSGAYERIVGRVHYTVAVADAHNRGIVDLDHAVNLTRGSVEFSSDVVILQPKDGTKGNGTLLLEIPNRGRARIVGLMDGGDSTAMADAGDGWLLRQGYSFVALGWQWDAVGDDSLKLHAPIAREHGRTITGLLRGDVMLAKEADEIPLGHLTLDALGGSEYAVAAADDPRNVLTVRDSPTASRQVIPRDHWSFGHEAGGRIEPSNRHLRLDGGFQPGRIYEYVYAVADPVIAGLGFAAVRDFAAYAKHDESAAVRARRVIGEGISQTGRFLRDFVYQGFNADEQGRIALDGILAHAAGAGRGSFNQRFAQPSRDAQPTSSVFFPTDVFPFTDLPEVDPAAHDRDGLLVRASAAHVVPKVFLSNTSYEYWGRVASLITTTADGARDVDLSPVVRVYHFTGLQHFSGPWPPARGTGALLGRQPQSPLPIRYFWRAMLTNMDDWLRGDISPPPSRYPRIADGTLVRVESYAFPKLPGTAVALDPSRAWHLDFGPRSAEGIPTVHPPKVGEPFPVLVPQVDTDGNERDGVRLPEFTAPLATYVPWNLRDPSIGASDQRVSFEGSYLPFAKDAKSRGQSGDPRPSIAERYRDKADYLERYARALDQLIAERFVLPEDRAVLLERGGEEWDFALK
jgi:hypothetical protein